MGTRHRSRGSGGRGRIGEMSFFRRTFEGLAARWDMTAEGKY